MLMLTRNAFFAVAVVVGVAMTTTGMASAQDMQGRMHPDQQTTGRGMMQGLMDSSATAPGYMMDGDMGSGMMGQHMSGGMMMGSGMMQGGMRSGMGALFGSRARPVMNLSACAVILACDSNASITSV
jgi:hypothetical protein